ncbi:DUF2269 family protein [Paenibacillus psychroresistens]|uniref:DUF2269 family protein n=1 Tax=Paenibacillus psychroresistens TaxID=1778678 RepID=A0A6B8REM9_9BACL|nr:DUF2269 family protein [Paenibacillus psychroresistens]QGQ94184.1 DUF2269 family protein [Paenibacillus psychroresistens]
MKWLVLVHVLSAIIGIGPTYAFLIILRKNQSATELKFSLRMGRILELFPKILGTLAVVTGLILVFVGEYGAFTQLWLLGSLILFIIIQVIVVAIGPRWIKSLTAWVEVPANQSFLTLPAPQASQLSKALGSARLASLIGLVLFIFMIMKPT